MSIIYILLAAKCEKQTSLRRRLRWEDTINMILKEGVCWFSLTQDTVQ